MSEKLKPCAHCGSRGELVTYYDFYHINCTNDGCVEHYDESMIYRGEGAWYGSIADAIEAWNTRTPEQVIAATPGSMSVTVDDALSLLDEMNEQGRIEYADYSQLHDAIAATLSDEPKSMRVFDSMETALTIAEKEVEIEKLKRENAELCDENEELVHRRAELEAATFGRVGSEVGSEVTSEVRGGKLTAEQVREAIERNVTFYEGGDYDAQEIADELNTMLGSGECTPHGEWKSISQTQEVRHVFCECGFELGMDRRDSFPFECTRLFAMPNFCQECGRKIRKAVKR